SLHANVTCGAIACRCSPSFRRPVGYPARVHIRLSKRGGAGDEKFCVSTPPPPTIDFAVITTRIALCVFMVGCATPMSALREDNRRLTQTVSDLRTDRRAQDRKLR